MSVTGERVSTPAGGFNPTWQRHVAAYRLCAPLLPDGRVLDLGCGVGHSFERAGPARDRRPRPRRRGARGPGARDGRRRHARAPVRRRQLRLGAVRAVDRARARPRARAGRGRARARARRASPSSSRPTGSPSPGPTRSSTPTTTSSTTPAQLAALCAPFFERGRAARAVRLAALPRARGERAAHKLDRLLRQGPAPAAAAASRARAPARSTTGGCAASAGTPTPGREAITVDDFELRADGLDDALDVVAVCRSPRRVGGVLATDGR